MASRDLGATGFSFWGACLLSAALSAAGLFACEAFVCSAFHCLPWLLPLARQRQAVCLRHAAVCRAWHDDHCVRGRNIHRGSEWGRLSWPYGDLVPGNYLAKACLPAFVVILALATSSDGRTASVAAIIALISLIASAMTGERINFLIRAFSGMLAALAWRPRPYRVIAVFAVEGIAVLSTIVVTPSLIARFFEQFVQQLPIHIESLYFRAMAPGWLAFEQAPVFGVGPGNLRHICADVTAGSGLYDCHPHPHNYFIQMLGEAGIVGLVMEHYLARSSGPARRLA